MEARADLAQAADRREGAADVVHCAARSAATLVDWSDRLWEQLDEAHRGQSILPWRGLGQTDALQHVLPEVHDLRAAQLRQEAVHVPEARRGGEDLAAVASAFDRFGHPDRRSRVRQSARNVVPRDRGGSPCVEAHADTQATPSAIRARTCGLVFQDRRWPGALQQLGLQLEAKAQCREGAVECELEGVPLRGDLVPVVLGDKPPDGLVVQLQRLMHRLRARLPQRGRALHISEDHGHFIGNTGPSWGVCDDAGRHWHLEHLNVSCDPVCKGFQHCQVIVRELWPGGLVIDAKGAHNQAVHAEDRHRSVEGEDGHDIPRCLSRQGVLPCIWDDHRQAQRDGQVTGRRASVHAQRAAWKTFQRRTFNECLAIRAFDKPSHLHCTGWNLPEGHSLGKVRHPDELGVVVLVVCYGQASLAHPIISAGLCNKLLDLWIVRLRQHRQAQCGNLRAAQGVLLGDRHSGLAGAVDLRPRSNGLNILNIRMEMRTINLIDILGTLAEDIRQQADLASLAGPGRAPDQRLLARPRHTDGTAGAAPHGAVATFQA
mmetsp:Transcript_125157/g.325179  ORF Transcript_125157/g.325179 Transcript_125157/m.325179 type:complete len:545 (+) Transcript_125157:702-2336(+)